MHVCDTCLNVISAAQVSSSFKYLVFSVEINGMIGYLFGCMSFLKKEKNFICLQFILFCLIHDGEMISVEEGKKGHSL